MIYFLLAIAVLLYYYVLINPEIQKMKREIKPVLPKPKDKETGDRLRKIGICQRAIMRRRRMIEDSYYDIVDTLEREVMSNGYVVDIREFDLSEFSVIEGWNRGAISSAEALERFNKMGDLERVAIDKVCKRLYKFAEDQKLDALTHNTVMEAIEELTLKVVPSYLVYLKTFKFYLVKLSEIDSTQVLLIHGRTINGGSCQVRNITLNQAIRYIKSNGLAKRDLKYKMCKYTVSFENQKLDKGVLRSAAIDWFVCPDPYRKIICDLFDINSNHVMGTTKESHLEFYKDIEKVVKGRLGA